MNAVEQLKLDLETLRLADWEREVNEAIEGGVAQLDAELPGVKELSIEEWFRRGERINEKNEREYLYLPEDEIV